MHSRACVCVCVCARARSRAWLHACLPFPALSVQACERMSAVRTCSVDGAVLWPALHEPFYHAENLVPSVRKSEPDRTFGSSLTPVGDALIRFGGHVRVGPSSHSSRNDAYLFNGTAWSAVSYATAGAQAVPSPRGSHCAVEYAGTLIVLLGAQRAPDGIVEEFRDVWQLNLTSRTWEMLFAPGSNNLADDPPARRSAACVRRGEHILVFGGVRGPYAPSSRHSTGGVREQTCLRKFMSFHVPSRTWRSVSEYASTNAPLPSYGLAVQYHVGLDALLLQGGFARSSETAPTLPSPTSGMRAFYFTSPVTG
ncbi:hypothetical protein EON67_11585, partial [archaeon]